MQRRRRATREELNQGEAEMQQAQERMQREAEVRGELPLEDQQRVGDGRDQGAEGVSAPPIEDGSLENSQGTPKASPSGAHPVSGSTVRPPTMPPVDPPEVPSEDQASAGIKTPADTKDRSKESAGGSQQKVSPSERLGTAVEGDRDRSVGSLVEPLFTPEQVQHFTGLFSQAPWLYTQPRSAFSPFLQRPQFLEHEELRAREASENRDQELERLKERLMQDQLEREEMRQSMKFLFEENRRLMQKLEAQEKQKEADPKFSTPEEDPRKLKQAGDPQKEAEIPPRSQAADPQKEAEMFPRSQAADPQREARSSYKEAGDHQREARSFSKEAADPQSEAVMFPWRFGSEEQRHPGQEGTGQKESSSSESFAERSLGFMALMMESMKEMQKKMLEPREEAGMVRGVEVVRTGVMELPALQQCNPAQGPLQLGDWLLMIEPVAADMSTTSREWWGEMTKAVETWYQQHMSMNPLDRISHGVKPPPQLVQDRWQRLERRMSTMLLQAVPEGVRDELVAGRKVGVFSILTHLFLTYCPGGVMEKQMLLRNLEEPPEVSQLVEAPAALRKWLRWKTRTVEIGAVVPDAALLLKGLNKMTRKVLESHKDLQFRIQLARSSLGVDTSPTELTVSRFATHLLAELDQVALTEKRSGGAPKVEGPKLKSLETEKQDKGKGKGQERGQEEGQGRPRCKFYMSDGGCKKGKLCGFSHDFKDEKKRRWTCGAVDHFSPNCSRPKGSTDGSPTRARVLKTEGEGKGGVQKDVESSSVAGSEASIKELMEEASKMLKSLTSANTTSSSSTTTASTSREEEGKEEVMDRLQQQLNALRLKTLRLRRLAGGGVQGLLDSGATNPLRPLKPGEETTSYRQVEVALANGGKTQLAITRGGTLVSPDLDIEPIVPMGLLIGVLGCKATWEEGGITVIHPKIGKLPINQSEGCPQVSRQLALQLIEEIEDKKLCIGEVASDFTKEEAWLERLIKEHPVLSSLPSWIQEGLKCEVGEWNHLPCNKRMRKRMKRDGYLLHLFAGPDQGFTLHRAWHQVGGEGWQLLEVDVERGEEQNLLKSKLYGGLMRTALEGKIRAIIGGPNCRTRSVLRHIPVEGHPEAPRPVRQWGGGEFGKKDLTDQEREQVRGDDLLMWRMLFLQMVSTYAARARGATKDPLFSLEQPASPKSYKPEVVSFWDTKEWHKLKKEFGWFEETFEQGSLGGKSPKPTTFGGSLKLTVEEYKTGDRRHPERVKSSKELSRWPPALMRMLATELMKQVYKMDPKIKQLSWQEHIACGHIPYRRDCRVCQETNQQCAPHRKTHHVIGGVLSIDTAGPLIGAYDQGGGMARYFLVGALTWRVPKGLEKLKQPAQEPLEGDEPKIEDKEEVEEEALEDGIFGDLPPMGADNNQAPGGELAAELGLGGGDPVRLAAPPRSDDVAELGLGGGDPVRLAAPLPGEAAAELGLGGGDPVRLVAPPEEKGPEDLEETTEVRVFRLALPMITKTAREVSATAMEFVLRLRADGFHIGRIHCDRGHEFEGAFKRWARSRGIYVTKTAGDDPQGNGQAEVAVKAIKSQIRRTLRQAGLDSAHWPWALRYVDELNRCVRKGIQPSWPPFYQEVRVKKRTWRRGAFEPVVEHVHYLCPSTEDHGHWVQKQGEPPRVTKFIMEKTTEPVEEGAWIALEGRIVDPWSTRRRLRGKTAVRRVHPTLDQEGEDSETEKKKEEVKQIYAVIEEEMRGIVDEDPEVASGIIHAVARLRKIATAMEESEEVLQTKIISPKEVSRKWGEWLESVDSEVQSLTKDKQALKELTAEEHEELKQQAEREGRRVEYIPSKLVHVVKAGEKGGKKKTRWVVCGNFEEKKEGEENYSGGADATAFRILIWCCGKFQWRAQIIDVRTAFLNADLELTEEENLLLIRPPHIMIEKGYLAPNTVYLPVKAIYGFRRSPRLWGRHRDHRMHQFVIKAKKEGKNIEVKLFQMGSEPNLWKVVQVMGEEEDELASLSNGRILGLVMTYVDDVFIAAEGDLVEAITAKFQETWTTSNPEEVSEKPTRFLGMEVEKIWSEEKERSEWFVTQSGYIKDLLERYDHGKEEKEKRIRKIPISRDLAIMEEDSQPPDLKRVRQCQREVGELMWLVTRTRPDIMYTISRMGAHVTKSTVKVLEAAEQTRDYLRGTWDQGLKFEEGKEKEVVIQVWSDASFAPEGEESHGCFTVMVNDSALLWRSGRQASITLSTAEAELNEIIEAMNAGESVATILYELFDDVKKIAWSDSQSALSILSSEGGSWRTRHLRFAGHGAKTRWIKRRKRNEEGSWRRSKREGIKCVQSISSRHCSQADHFGCRDFCWEIRRRWGGRTWSERTQSDDGSLRHRHCPVDLVGSDCVEGRSRKASPGHQRSIWRSRPKSPCTRRSNRGSTKSPRSSPWHRGWAGVERLIWALGPPPSFGPGGRGKHDPTGWDGVGSGKSSPPPCPRRRDIKLLGWAEPGCWKHGSSNRRRADQNHPRRSRNVERNSTDSATTSDHRRSGGERCRRTAIQCSSNNVWCGIPQWSILQASTRSTSRTAPTIQMVSGLQKGCLANEGKATTRDFTLSFCNWHRSTLRWTMPMDQRRKIDPVLSNVPRTRGVVCATDWKILTNFQWGSADVTHCFPWLVISMMHWHVNFQFAPICISIHAAVHSCPFETQERNLAEKPKVRAVGGAGRAQIEKSNKFIHFYIAEPTWLRQ